MTEFTARRHRLNIPSSSGSDDPAVLKKEMSTMRQLMMDEFNRMADDFYLFKKTTFESGVLPLKQVNNLAVTFDEYSVNAVWENPQQDTLTPTHVRVRILEISPNDWAEYSYPKDSWEFNGLSAGTQYTLQVQLIGRYEATDTFVSTTRNCPSVPVLRIAESAIKAKVFTTDDGVGAPTDPGLTDPEIEFPFPDPPDTGGTVGSSGCWWEYGYQNFSIGTFSWADIGSLTEFSGLVSSVVTDTSAAPFSSFTDGVFRMKYRSVCNGVDGDWVYTPSFTLADATACGPSTASVSAGQTPYSTADLYAIPVPCFGVGEWLFAKDSVSDTEVVNHFPAYSGLGRVDDEWTYFGADTSGEVTGYGQLATATLPLIAELNDTSDFTISHDFYFEAQYLNSPGGQPITYPVLVLGNKIKISVIHVSASVYSLIVVVPRDGGGQYSFRADNLSYQTWTNLYYVHDTSEADGRILYINGVEVDRSANAIENDFDGIDGTFKLYGFPEVRYRKMYGWKSAIDADTIAEANVLYNAWSYLPTYASDSTSYDVAVGDVVFCAVNYRDIGYAAAGAPATPGGTAVWGSWSYVSAGINYDSLGVSDGEFRVSAAVCTTAGNITNITSGAARSTHWVLVPGLETTGATDVTAAYGTVTNTKGTEASSTMTATPGAAGSGGYRLLTFFGCGGPALNAGAGTGSRGDSLKFSSSPSGEHPDATIYEASSGYLRGGTWFATDAAYSTSTQTFTVSDPPNLAAGGLGAVQIELVED